MDVDELLEKMSDTMRNKREKCTDEPEFVYNLHRKTRSLRKIPVLDMTREKKGDDLSE